MTDLLEGSVLGEALRKIRSDNQAKKQAEELARVRASQEEQIRKRASALVDFHAWLRAVLLEEATSDCYIVHINWHPEKRCFMLIRDGKPIETIAFPFEDVDEPDVLLMLCEKFQGPDFDLTLLLQRDGEQYQQSARAFVIRLN